MEGRERGREGNVKESEGETRCREGFGPPKILEWRPLCNAPVYNKWPAVAAQTTRSRCKVLPIRPIRLLF